jgi:hypothetical protein
MIAQGVRSELEAFLDAIRTSELGGFIRDEEVRWSEAESQFKGFEIAR